MRWISTVYMGTNQFTLSWPSHRPPPLKTLATTPSKNLRRLWHQSYLTPRLLEAVIPSTRRLGERRKSINVWINSRTRVEKTLAPPLPWTLTAGLRKTCPKSRASTVTKKGTTRGTALSPERICQKTSISLGDFRSNDWH